MKANWTAIDARMGEQRTVSDEHARAYISWVAKCWGTGSIGSAGLMCAVNAKGLLKYAVLPDLMQLGLSHRQFVEQHMGRSQQLARQENKYDHGVGQGFGYEILQGPRSPQNKRICGLGLHVDPVDDRPGWPPALEWYAVNFSADMGGEK